MKCTFFTPESENIIIPEIGDVWKHRSIGNSIYMRIYDHQGRSVFEYMSDFELDKKFFSVDLSDGSIVYTSLNPNDDIIILKPKQVVDGVIEFEPVD